LGLDVGDLAKANFDRLGMTRTSLVWRDGLDTNVADGWNDQGHAYDKRSKVRVAGSMDTTISDLPGFVAALVSGDGLSAASCAEMTKPQLHITTAHQFPLFLPICRRVSSARICTPDWASRRIRRPAGARLLQGGHDGQTANSVVCIEAGQRCVVILSNDVRSEAGFADLVRFILGDAGVPYDWEYGDHPESRELAVSLPVFKDLTRS
jgi:hypothetical protein